MTVAVTHVAWKPCWRIIPSQFPPIALFERVTEPDDLEAIFELESLTNPRLRDEVGEISLVPLEEPIAAVRWRPERQGQRWAAHPARAGENRRTESGLFLGSREE